MSFVIRAALVIGVLSYLAMNRDQPGLAPRAEVAVPSLADAWEAMPASARERLVREGTAEVGRRMAAVGLVSRDTLADSDRQPPWRGTGGR